MQQQTSGTNSFAVASLVVGIVAVLSGLLYVGGLLGIAAIVFGVIALRRSGSRGLAIAGIILGSLGILATILAVILVALAVPALQKNQRDTVRKNDVGLIVSEIQSFQTNNKGTLPDPSEVALLLKTRKLDVIAEGTPTDSTALYEIGVNCAGESSVRAFSVMTKLESGQAYCQGS